MFTCDCLCLLVSVCVGTLSFSGCAVNTLTGIRCARMSAQNGRTRLGNFNKQTSENVRNAVRRVVVVVADAVERGACQSQCAAKYDVCIQHITHAHTQSVVSV